MNRCVEPGAFGGRVGAPPSKSAAHRALICAALAGAQASPVSTSADMRATLGVLESFGFPSERRGDAVCFQKGAPVRKFTCNCKESGSTLRFLLPVAAALGLEGTFLGEGRLPQRPLEPLLSLMKAHGVSFSADLLPFSISGKLTSGHFALAGDVSSQFVSGLLFALPLLFGESEIEMTSELQSAGYVEMTLRALRKAGIDVTYTSNRFRVPGGQSYHPGIKAVEGDWSNAAFWLCAGALFGAVTVTGLDMDTAQGDAAVVEILREMGAQISCADGAVTVSPAPLRGIRIDAAPIPDLVPILAVTAAFAQGDTEIYNAARLRIKESDRLASVSNLLRALGGSVEEYPDRLCIHGGRPLTGGTVDGVNDHRIVMSAAIAALGCSGAVNITDAQAVEKSYPDFFECLEGLRPSVATW